MKSLVITPEMQARINAAAGTEVDPSSITAFECIALTRAPINKRGTIFEGAVNDPGMYGAMAALLARNSGIQILAMHNNEMLPLGRAFHAAEAPDGLRVQFYVPNNKPELIADINTGVIGQVSCGYLAKQLLCSNCGWDYRGEGASIMNIIDRECANGHKIGEGGTHVKLTGLDDWFELSLCGLGASTGAKIVSRLKVALKNSSADLVSLAASGISPEAVTVLTTNSEDNMDLAAFTAQLTEKVTEIATLKGERDALTTQLTAAQGDVTRLTTELTAANAAKATAEAAKTAAETAKADAEAKLATATTANDAVTAFLKEQGEAAMVQLGKKKEDLPSEPEKIMATIKEAGVHISNLIAASNRSNLDRAKERGEGKAYSPASAFTTRHLNH